MSRDLCNVSVLDFQTENMCIFGVQCDKKITFSKDKACIKLSRWMKSDGRILKGLLETTRVGLLLPHRGHPQGGVYGNKYLIWVVLGN